MEQNQITNTITRNKMPKRLKSYTKQELISINQKHKQLQLWHDDEEALKAVENAQANDVET